MRRNGENSLEKLIVTVDGWIWALPLIVLIFGSAIYFTIRMRFVQLRDLKHQVHVLFRKRESEVGVTPIESFMSIVGYRVGTANIAGVCVAVLWGGPGAIVWMLICSLLDAAISYAECALGNIYKVEQDGEYRGGSYYYLSRGLGLKKLAAIFAVLTIICVPVLTVGPHANSIALAFNAATGVPKWIFGLIIALILLWTVFGGIKRISKVATVVVPIITIGYIVCTIIVIVCNITSLPSLFATIFTSAFGANAVFGGLMGKAISWGVKRSVNSSGAGMGEAVPTACAAEAAHPGESGLVNSFSVFIDVSVCFCTGLMILLTDCFNVVAANGKTYIHIGNGAISMREMAKTFTAGIPWTQNAVGTLFGRGGSIFIACCILMFGFTTVLNYYYQGETAFVYLLKGTSAGVRKMAILILRLVVPAVFFIFAVSTANATWSIGEIGVGIMVWTNVIVLLVMSPSILKVYRDYQAQRDLGIEEPLFDPDKVGIKNADIWKKINAERFAARAAEMKKIIRSDNDADKGC